jgi:hypothetical protein
MTGRPEAAVTSPGPTVGMLCACNISSSIVVLACCCKCGQQDEALSRCGLGLRAGARCRGTQASTKAAIRWELMEGDLAVDATEIGTRFQTRDSIDSTAHGTYREIARATAASRSGLQSITI